MRTWEAPSVLHRDESTERAETDVSDIASLLLALAGVITALGAAAKGIIIAIRVPRLAAAKAAQRAISKAVGDDDDSDDDDDLHEAVQAMLEKMLEQRGGKS
jgi:hypothetical protein